MLLFISSSSGPGREVLAASNTYHHSGFRITNSSTHQIPIVFMQLEQKCYFPGEEEQGWEIIIILKISWSDELESLVLISGLFPCLFSWQGAHSLFALLPSAFG